jgi:2-phosphosulfolactate phosphatase
MAKIHVLLRKEDIDPQQIDGKVLVVLDILFATSTIVTALAAGAEAVYPALHRDDALDQAQRHNSDEVVLAGELNAKTLPGFKPTAPLRLSDAGVSGKKLIYSTTNGTVALRLSATAAHIYAAALLNGEATMQRIARLHPGENVLVVCSGSGGAFNLEDFYGAGHIVDQFAAAVGPSAEFSDAALAARLFYRNNEGAAALLACRVGRMMAAAEQSEEVHFALREAHFEHVCKLTAGWVRLA